MVDQGVAAAFAKQPLAHWNDKLLEAGVMFSPVLTFPEVFEDPRVQRDLVVEVDHPRSGKFKLITNPIRLSETPPSTRTAPPVLGQHTDEVFAEFGISRAVPAETTAG
ncbi:Formyl-CoA:oxalate CoA-transferase [compost metagenome]